MRMTNKHTYKIERDGNGWGVTDAEGFVNPAPFVSKKDAEKFKRECLQDHADIASNNAYWAQSCFGE